MSQTPNEVLEACASRKDQLGVRIFRKITEVRTTPPALPSSLPRPRASFRASSSPPHATYLSSPGRHQGPRQAHLRCRECLLDRGALAVWLGDSRLRRVHLVQGQPTEAGPGLQSGGSYLLTVIAGILRLARTGRPSGWRGKAYDREENRRKEMTDDRTERLDPSENVITQHLLTSTVPIRTYHLSTYLPA